MSDPGSATADPRLLDVLARARDLGLLGPGPVLPHVQHGLGYLPALDGVTGAVADLGSGAGVPGLPIALSRPDLRVLLLDAGASRVAFLRDAVARLELVGRVEVVEGRAEVVGRGPWRGALDAVVARGFGSPAVTAECGAPLLRVGGRLVVSEPPAPPAGRWPADGVAPLGLRVGPALAGPPHLQVLEQVEPCPDRYPRRVGVPAKRPLF